MLDKFAEEAKCGYKIDVCLDRQEAGQPVCTGEGEYCQSGDDGTSYSCLCKNGYTRNLEDTACVDDNECELEAGQACITSGGTCINKPGSFECVDCPMGTSSNGIFCERIDNCADGSHNCGEFEICKMGENGHQCFSKCDYFAEGDVVILVDDNGDTKQFKHDPECVKSCWIDVEGSKYMK